MPVGGSWRASELLTMTMTRAFLATCTMACKLIQTPSVALPLEEEERDTLNTCSPPAPPRKILRANSSSSTCPACEDAAGPAADEEETEEALGRRVKAGRKSLSSSPGRTTSLSVRARRRLELRVPARGTSNPSRLSSKEPRPADQPPVGRILPLRAEEEKVMLGLLEGMPSSGRSTLLIHKASSSPAATSSLNRRKSVELPCSQDEAGERELQVLPWREAHGAGDGEQEVALLARDRVGDVHADAAEADRVDLRHRLQRGGGGEGGGWNCHLHPWGVKHAADAILGEEEGDERRGGEGDGFQRCDGGAGAEEEEGKARSGGDVCEEEVPAVAKGEEAAGHVAILLPRAGREVTGPPRLLSWQLLTVRALLRPEAEGVQAQDDGAVRRQKLAVGEVEQDARGLSGKPPLLEPDARHHLAYSLHQGERLILHLLRAHSEAD
eukprot:752155-Hanusia_phi.AAC.1